MSNQPMPRELTVQEIIDQYLIEGRQANIDLAIEKGWDMESGAPSYVCTDTKSAERVKRIRAELSASSHPAKPKKAEQKTTPAITPVPSALQRGI